MPFTSLLLLFILIFFFGGGMVWLGLLRDPTKSLMVDEVPFLFKLLIDNIFFYFSTLLLIPSSLVAALLLPDMFLKLLPDMCPPCC